MELLEQDSVIEISTVAEKFNISREDQSLLCIEGCMGMMLIRMKNNFFRCCWNLQMFSHSAPRT